MGRNWVCLACAIPLLTACVGEQEAGDRPLEPYRGEWIDVASPLPFPHTDRDGNPQITTIKIGGEPIPQGNDTDNFANRGDVTVEFWDREEINIEYRPFAMSRREGSALDSISMLEVVASIGGAKRPDELSPDEDCLQGWQDGCEIRVFQYGRGQEIRTGADLRVTLPKTYRQTIEVGTSDLEAPGYHNRGNICVQGLPGSLSAEVDFGQVFVSLAQDITPAPGCAPDEVAACEASGWDDTCNCTGSFGAVTVESRRDSFNALLSIPRALWAYARLRGSSDCARTIESDEFVADVDDPERLEGAFSPPPGVREGYGYQLIAASQGCTTVPSTEGLLLQDIEDDLQLGNAQITHDIELSCAQMLGR